MLSNQNTVLMIVDMQGKLAQVMHERDALVRNLQILIQGSRLLGVPVVWLEQNPKGLGPTIPEVADLLIGEKAIAKMSFSACGSPEATKRLSSLNRRQVLLAGIEAHVCIYLSAADLLARGYHVEVVADAVSSRTLANKEIGLGKVAALGGGITGTESVLFELLERADNPVFRDIVKLVR
jgi:nicotinamidase-related amidase